MQPKDVVRLRHMLDSVQAILSFAEGKSRTDLDTNRQLLSAIVRELEILGEAANYVLADTQSRTLQVPYSCLL